MVTDAIGPANGRPFWPGGAFAGRRDIASDRLHALLREPGGRLPQPFGGWFEATDRMGAPGAAIVNEAFVRRYLQGEDPLGKPIQSGADAFTIVGVAQDGKYRAL